MSLRLYLSMTAAKWRLPLLKLTRMKMKMWQECKHGSKRSEVDWLCVMLVAMNWRRGTDNLITVYRGVSMCIVNCTTCKYCNSAGVIWTSLYDWCWALHWFKSLCIYVHISLLLVSITYLDLFKSDDTLDSSKLEIAKSWFLIWSESTFAGASVRQVSKGQAVVILQHFPFLKQIFNCYVTLW